MDNVNRSSKNITPVTLKGVIHKIVFLNKENNYAVARFLQDGKDEPVTAVGVIPDIAEGKYGVISGKWEYNQKFGPQIFVNSFRECRPSTCQGIEKFLGSGLIEGIGPEIASRIVAKFKEKTLDVIDSEPGRLSNVEGIGKKRLKQIVTAWQKNRDMRNILIALNDMGISSALATRIYNKYNKDTLSIIDKNPYRLAYDLHGVGFRKADEIAVATGITPDSPKRIEAALYYCLFNFTEEGDVYTPYRKLIDKTAYELKIPTHLVEEICLKMETAKKISIEKYNGDKLVYTQDMFTYESTIAQRLAKMAVMYPEHKISVTVPELKKLALKMKIEIDNELPEQLSHILNRRLAVVTGGPGTGKTTLVKLILSVLTAKHISVCLAAPTGRAAKRMHETTGFDAMTVHRLLEYNPAKNMFMKNEYDPLDTDTLILDETSMLDITCLFHILKALPSDCRLIMVGDSDQLPSVGPGAILQNLVDIKNVPKIKLTRIYRQAQNSYIVQNAHRINHGQKLLLPDSAADFFFIEQKSAESSLKIIKKIIKERIPNKFKFNPLNDIQVLSPMKKGILGVDSLNVCLQELLNKSVMSVSYANNIFKLGDKVMQTKNNYDLDVFNGDIGFISNIDEEAKEVTINFYGKRVVYEQSWLEQVCLAYAISIHKSQGSEYPAVVIPLTVQHVIMLQKNLLYTAVTRGKKLVVLVGEKDALYRCLNNNRITRRYSLLAQRIKKIIGN
ncbi:ATP-dependent RecD-like DNA helicase [bacterium]|nr:ATP-dependent RecD-like DNA helicase [bacterium]